MNTRGSARWGHWYNAEWYSTMKLLRSTIAFFTDDFLTAGLVIAWICVSYLVNKARNIGVLGAGIYLAGMVGILVFGAWRKAKSG